MNKKQSRIKNGIMLLGIVGLLIALDQWSKALVRDQIALGSEVYPIPFLAPFFRFTYWKNTGAAFGIFQNANLPLLILSILIAGALIWLYFKSEDEPLIFRISLAMMLGGAIGNMIDRISFGFVTDFIAVGRFPVFNIADSAVTVGVGIMLITMLIHERKTKSETADGAQSE
ncbi:MAG: signal peptidase II [Anaerolineaceae bacterium]|nr:signal peptidase II [Anaerolineaceae bacterium]